MCSCALSLVAESVRTYVHAIPLLMFVPRTRVGDIYDIYIYSLYEYEYIYMHLQMLHTAFGSDNKHECQADLLKMPHHLCVNTEESRLWGIPVHSSSVRVST